MRDTRVWGRCMYADYVCMYMYTCLVRVEDSPGVHHSLEPTHEVDSGLGLGVGEVVGLHHAQTWYIHTCGREEGGDRRVSLRSRSVGGGREAHYIYAYVHVHVHVDVPCSAEMEPQWSRVYSYTKGSMQRSTRSSAAGSDTLRCKLPSPTWPSVRSRERERKRQLITVESEIKRERE